MPLNVQPLSRTRQIIRLLVLLALLVASLGFAQYLTTRHPTHPTVSFHLDQLGFTAPLPEVDNFDYQVEGRSGIVAGNPRELRILYGPYNPKSKPAFPLPEDLLTDLSHASDTKTSIVNISAHAWLQVEARTADKSFMIVRFLIVSDHALVICYSGDGQKTDADTSTLDTLCATAAHMNLNDLPKD